MGSASLTALLPAPPPQPDDAYEIGAMPVSSEITAMRVGFENSRGEAPIYLEESPISVATVWRVLETSEGARHRWWRLETKVRSRGSGIQRGHEFVLAEHPYANGWLHHAPFKPGSKKGAMERVEPPQGVLGSTASSIGWVEEQRFDFWEKGNYLTAGISEPNLPFSPGKSLRNVQRQALFVFGTCEDFRRCEQLLLQSQTVRELLRQTDEGTIRFWPPKLPARPMLREEVKTEASSLMGLAIRQALAGPHNNGEKWIGRPVAKKVDQIYRGHLNSRNRQVAREQQRLGVFDDRLDYGDAWSGDEDDVDRTWNDEADDWA